MLYLLLSLVLLSDPPPVVDRPACHCQFDFGPCTCGEVCSCGNVSVKKTGKVSYETFFADVNSGKYTKSSPGILAVGTDAVGAHCKVPAGYAGCKTGVYFCYWTGPSKASASATKKSTVFSAPAISGGCASGNCPAQRR